MILGRSFAGEPSTLSSTLPAADTIERLTLENAIYDETYVSVAITKPDNFDGSIPSIAINSDYTYKSFACRSGMKKERNR